MRDATRVELLRIEARFQVQSTENTPVAAEIKRHLTGSNGQ